MKWKMIAVIVLVVVCVGTLVVRGVSQSPTSSINPPSAPRLQTSPPPLAPLGDPIKESPKVGTATAPPSAALGSTCIHPRINDSPPQQDLSFEQLAETLKSVRARQKELKAQETDILAKMAAKIEEKRRDLQQAEEVFQQFQNSPRRGSDLPLSGSSFMSNNFSGQPVHKASEKK